MTRAAADGKPRWSSSRAALQIAPIGFAMVPRRVAHAQYGSVVTFGDRRMRHVQR
jgi:hypothetical protein